MGINNSCLGVLWRVEESLTIIKLAAAGKATGVVQMKFLVQNCLGLKADTKCPLVNRI